MSINLERRACLALYPIHFLSKMTKEMGHLFKSCNVQAVNSCQLEKEVWLTSASDVCVHIGIYTHEYTHILYRNCMYTCAMLTCSFASSNTISSKISVCIAEEVQHYEEPKLIQFILEFKWQPPPNHPPPKPKPQHTANKWPWDFPSSSKKILGRKKDLNQHLQNTKKNTLLKKHFVLMQRK